MNILVLGASSLIGSALSQEFSPGNNLYLGGRNGIKLLAVKRSCEDAGAEQVSTIEFDLSDNLDFFFHVLSNVSIDLIIDAASASSANRDQEIDSKNMEKFFHADLISRIKIFDWMETQYNSFPDVIFISTILTKVRSPGRVVYTSLKSVYEIYLNSLRIRRPVFKLLVVYIGTVVDTKSDSSAKPLRIASHVAAAFKRGDNTLNYGLSGRFYVLLYYIQPLVFVVVCFVQRNVRRLFMGGENS